MYGFNELGSGQKRQSADVFVISQRGLRNFWGNKKSLLVAVERLMRNEAANVTEKFPPKCTGMFHQPDRPVSINKEKE